MSKVYAELKLNQRASRDTHVCDYLRGSQSNVVRSVEAVNRSIQEYSGIDSCDHTHIHTLLIDVVTTNT